MLLFRQIRRRFGDISAEVENQIQSLSIEQLENLGEAIVEFSDIDDILQWLQEQES